MQMGYSVTYQETIACAAIIIPIHSAWKTVFWAPKDVKMFRSSANTSKLVPDLVLDPTVKILNSLGLSSS